MRDEKGITLVALILIVFVLIILAVISVSLVVSNESKNVEINPSSQVVTNQTSSIYSEDIDNENDVEEVAEENVVDADENTVVNEENVVSANSVEAENVVE